MKNRPTPPSPSRPLPLVTAALAALLLLVGCGQRGPLYLPDEPSSGQPVETRGQESAEGEEGSASQPGFD